MEFPWSTTFLIITSIITHLFVVQIEHCGGLSASPWVPPSGRGGSMQAGLLQEFLRQDQWDRKFTSATLRRLLSVSCGVTSLERQRRRRLSILATPSNVHQGTALSSPDRASMGWEDECRALSSKVTLGPSELPSQLMETWLQSSASMRGRLFEWPLMSISPSKLHWLDLPFRPEPKPNLLESSFSLNSDPSTWRSSGPGLEWKHTNTLERADMKTWWRLVQIRWNTF